MGSASNGMRRVHVGRGSFIVLRRSAALAIQDDNAANRFSTSFRMTGEIGGRLIQKQKGRPWAALEKSLMMRSYFVGVLATAGVAVAVLGSPSAAGRTLYGDMLAAASLIAWAWYFVASKQTRRHLGALEYQVP